MAACERYRQQPENGGKYPAKLADVVGDLEQGRNGLIDPWGRPYRYAVVMNDRGEAEVYVWTERDVDGKLAVYGRKRAADDSELFIGSGGD